MQRAKSNVLVAVEWLWSNRGKDIWWTPAVLTSENKDPKSPNLTIVEAISIFKLLAEKGLIIPGVRSGGPVFFLHEAKEKEWNTLISELASEQKENIPDKKQNELGVIIRDSILTGAFTTLSRICFATDHKFFGLWFGFIAIGSVLHIPFQHFRKTHPPQRKMILRSYVGLLFVLFVWVTCWSFSLRRKPVEPESPTQSEHLGLTNVTKSIVVQGDNRASNMTVNMEDKSKTITQSAGPNNQGSQVAAIDSPNLTVNLGPKKWLLTDESMQRIWEKLLLVNTTNTSGSLFRVRVSGWGNSPGISEMVSRVHSLFQRRGFDAVWSKGQTMFQDEATSGMIVKARKYPDAGMLNVLNQIYKEINHDPQIKIDEGITRSGHHMVQEPVDLVIEIGSP